MISALICSSKPGVWVMMLRSVMGPSARAGILKSRYSLTSLSRSSLPCSTSCITAVQGKQLGNRAGAEHRALRIHRFALLHVGQSVAFGEDHFAILDHRNYAAGDIAAFDGIRHEAIQPRLEIASLECMSGVQVGCGRRLGDPWNRESEAEQAGEKVTEQRRTAVTRHLLIPL